MRLKSLLARIWMRKDDKAVYDNEVKAMGPGVAPKELKK